MAKHHEKEKAKTKQSISVLPEIGKPPFMVLALNENCFTISRNHDVVCCSLLLLVGRKTKPVSSRHDRPCRLPRFGVFGFHRQHRPAPWLDFGHAHRDFLLYHHRRRIPLLALGKQGKRKRVWRFGGGHGNVPSPLLRGRPSPRGIRHLRLGLLKPWLLQRVHRLRRVYAIDDRFAHRHGHPVEEELLPETGGTA